MFTFTLARWIAVFLVAWLSYSFSLSGHFEKRDISFLNEPFYEKYEKLSPTGKMILWCTIGFVDTIKLTIPAGIVWAAISYLV